jgi:hypothetical protein
MDELSTGNRHATLKALSEQFTKIGWDKKFQDLTQDEALAIIAAIQSVSGDQSSGILDLNPNATIEDEEIPF